MKEFNFTTAFAMRCDAEQYASVKDKLKEMGYNVQPFDERVYLCTNYFNQNKRVEMLTNPIGQPLVIETFNRDLCLALAAMTDRKKPIIGEWVVAVKEGWDITVGKLYKVVDGDDDDKDGTDNHYAHIIDDAGDLHHFTRNFFKEHFCKATVEELIKHFTNEEKQNK